MDKSWMQIKDRWKNPAYGQGVKDFLNFAFANKEPQTKIPCPCIKCNNFFDQTREVMEDHLFICGVVKGYVRWIHHGEDFGHSSSDDECEADYNEDEAENADMHDMLHDIASGHIGHDWGGRQESTTHDPYVPNGKVDSFHRLLNDAEQELYPGCKKYSMLSFIVKLLHLKTMNRWSDKSFNMLIELIKDALPIGETLPASYYEAKKIIRDLGLDYVKIHACVYDCVLFWKEYEDWNTCPKCGTSRWKSEGSKKIPQKVLRYFPLKPRLQRLFVNKDIARDMRWHKDKRIDEDNVMRHPADSEAWKDFDRKQELFAQDPRNVRMGLASDGFNPFGNMSNAYSIWPVFLVPYNLPPWKCLKDPFFIMSMLIPGPTSPGNDIDVFLRPLIDELKELWEDGIDTFDAYTGQTFQLRATLLWTINDFPAYANLSGWSTKGYKACPVCMGETSSLRLCNGHKCCYMGHRRFLPSNHRWRREMKTFDGKKDFRDPVQALSGDEILNHLNTIEQVEFGKSPGLIKRTKKRKRKENDLNWTKRSIFFELPYWKTLKLRHNLDIMHIEKNVCDNILGTLMNIVGKTKDTWKARKDLMDMGLKPELHLRREGDSFFMPPACYNLSHDEKKNLCEFLNSIKFPDGFASNFSRCVKMKECRVSGMKSHDCHVFLQRILPLAIRGYLCKEVTQALVELSNFFRQICSRTLHLNQLEKLEKEIPITLCKLERIFPPAFFDVMIHLIVHLATEAKVAGPAQYRWMWPFERKMGTLKGYVPNKARPEGSIAERYIQNECLTFCSIYLRDVETIFNRPDRNQDIGEQEEKLDVFACDGRAFGGPKYDKLDDIDLENAHMYVLSNCEAVESYITEHKDELKAESTRDVEQRHKLHFTKWFEHRVKQLYREGRGNDELLSLAKGPDNRVKRYSGCNINGFRFHTNAREMNRKTQNSGIVVNGEHDGKSFDFYGVITDIIELEYLLGNKHVLLFKCDWWNTSSNKGIQIDKEWNITSVNISRKWYTDQPFVLASQAVQVFYVDDRKLSNNWRVVERINPRGFYDVPEHEEEEEEELIDIEDPYQEEDPCEDVAILEVDEIPLLRREDLDALQRIDAEDVLRQDSVVRVNEGDQSFINNDDIEEVSTSSDDESVEDFDCSDGNINNEDSPSENDDFDTD